LRGGDAFTSFGTEFPAASTLALLGGLGDRSSLGGRLASTLCGPAGALRGGNAFTGFGTKLTAASALAAGRLRSRLCSYSSGAWCA